MGQILAKPIPTINDVAKLAGVGTATVSRVVNQGPNVRQEVRERVMRAVETLGYRVNVQARNLASRTSREIALVHSSSLDTEPNSYYNAGLELGALRGCADLGFHLSNHNINQNGPAPADRVIALAAGGRYQGMILTPPLSDDVDLIQRLNGQEIAVACISAGPEARHIAPSVGIDDRAAGRDIARYLIGLGHRSFGFIRGTEGHLSAEGRYVGFLEALEEAGLAWDGVRTERGGFNFQSGIACAERILQHDPRPTALICANDDMAAGAMFTAHKLGLDIPGEVSITGFDDSPVSGIIWPPLTTIHQPIREIGRRAVEIIAEALTQGMREQPRLELIPHHLAERDSAAPPSQ